MTEPYDITAPESMRTIWENADWEERRQIYAKYRNDYEGDYLLDITNKRDTDGKAARKFPLDMNLVKLGCDVHRDMVRGIPEAEDHLPIKTSLARKGEEAEQKRIGELEEALNELIWTHSRGGPILQEGLLDTNIYGGCAFQVTWEPWNVDLPLRLGVRKLDPAFIFPVWDDRDPWRLIECYVGFEIEPEVAEKKYGVDPAYPGVDPLYMEHWTQTTWRVTVDDVVPIMEWGEHKWEMEGENAWGFVPVFYIPHERTTSWYGDSQVQSQIELSKTFNTKSANVSDMVQATRSGVYWMTDTKVDHFNAVPLYAGDILFGWALDMGSSTGMPGSHPPALNPIPIPDIPSGLIEFPQQVLNDWMITNRISPAAFGMDDTGSGRITGVAVNTRMWTGIGHATTERINFNTGKTLIDQSLLAMLHERISSKVYEELELDVPEIATKATDRYLTITQNWAPSLPIDKQQENDELLQRLIQGGVSLGEYLREKKVPNPVEEAKNIYEHLEKVAKIEAEAQPEPFGGGGNTSGQSSPQNRTRQRTTSN